MRTATENKSESSELQATIDTDALRQYVSAIKAVTDECVFEFGDSGLSTSAIDPANVAMIDIELLSDAFDELEGEGRIGVSTGRLQKFLEPGPGAHHPDGPIDNPLGEKTSLTIDFEKQDIKLESGAYDYSYAAIHPEHVRGEPNMPEMDLAATVELNASKLRNATEYIHNFTDRVSILFDPLESELVFEGMEKKGTDGGSVSFSGDDVLVHENGEAQSLLSTDYLVDFARSARPLATVTIQVGEEFPGFFEYRFAGGYGTVSYMQAPRIMSD